jgi:hypothetical protein
VHTIVSLGSLRDEEGRIGVGIWNGLIQKLMWIGYFLCTVILSGIHMDFSVWDESENGRFRLSGLISEIVISFMTVFNHYLISTFDFLISFNTVFMSLINS